MPKKTLMLQFVMLVICLVSLEFASAQVVRQSFTESGELKETMPQKAKDEKLPPPLVDEKLKLIPLSPNESIFLAEDRSCVVLLGEICLREGLLEFFVCTKNTKEHESIIATVAKPSLLHVGLLAMGAEPGKPVQFTPKFVAASGPRIDIAIRWLDENGKQQEAKAEEWVQEADSKKQMSTYWVFTGSLFRKLENGKNQYLADVTGEVIGVSNFPSVVLDLPVESTSDNSSLLFQAFTEKIPKEGTLVTIIFTKNENSRENILHNH